MWEDIWLSVLIVIVIIFTGLGVCGIVAEHKPQMYYIAGSYNPGFSIRASINWSEDPEVFVTDDIDKADRVLINLNNTLKK